MEVNIPRSNTDNFYRYRMPVIKTKIEGKGNGIRTVIVNMGKIMKALDRPIDHGTKFIGFELGAQTKSDAVHNNAIISGKHDDEQLALCLDKFIDTYILCIKCKNPETTLTVKKGNIISKCKACGKIFKIDLTHKLSNYILKTESSKQPVTHKNDLLKIIKVENVEKDGEVWSMDTSQSAVNARKQRLYCDVDTDGTELGSEAYPAENFVNYISTERDEKEFKTTLNLLKVSQGWSDNTLIKYIFMGLFSNGNIRNDFYKKIKYISYYINNEKEMTLLLMCIEKFMESHDDCIPETIHFINGFYEEGILDEDIIFKWYDSKNKIISEELSQKIKDNINPFIEWLTNAETVLED